MHIVTKELYFCYGHRLMKHPGRCRHLHGHSVKASISVRSDTLNEHSMVCDFSDIRAAAECFIDAQLDHNLLLFKGDPMVPILEAQGERFLSLEEHPTAEVISKLIFEDLKKRGIDVHEVSLWETSSSFASYSVSP